MPWIAQTESVHCNGYMKPLKKKATKFQVLMLNPLEHGATEPVKSALSDTRALGGATLFFSVMYLSPSPPF